MTAPAGDFILNRADRRPVVLMSGGVGLTPMVSMLNTLVETSPDRPVTFIHAVRNGDLHAMRDHVVGLAQKHAQLKVYFCYQEPTDGDREQQAYDKEGYIDLPWLKSILPNNDACFYFCGPVPFMRSMNRALKEWGVAADNIHYEFFGPAGSLEEPAIVTPVSRA